MDITQQMEQFNIGYIRALAAACGFGTAKPEVDDDSVDMIIHGKSSNQRTQIQIQLKSTCESSIAKKKKQNGIHYSLKQKNYNDLTGDYLIPRYLFLLIVPDNPKEWLPENQLLLQKCYWLNLSNHKPNQNKCNTTVVLPNQNLLSHDILTQIMLKAIKGETL